MILDWLAHTPVLLVGIGVVFVPGVLALYGVGMRGLGLLAAGPVFSVASTAVIAVVLGATGIGWSPRSWGVASLLLIVLAWAIARLLGCRPSVAPGALRRWYLPTAIGLGVLLGGWRLVAYISDPAGVSQTNDAVFHMNAVRFILETADASSLHVNSVIGGSGFYPSAWHGMVSLIAMLTGASIAVATNMFTLVIGAIIWPLGLAWLTRSVTGSNAAAGYAAVLSSALQTFPLLMFQWGVLFPNALSTALLPAAVALVISLPVWSSTGSRWRDAVRNAVLILVAAGALALSQPAALLPWAAISATWLTAWLIRRAGALGWVRFTVIIVAMWVGLILGWRYLSRGTSGSHWPPFRGKLGGLLDVLLNGQVLIPYAYAISALMIIGLVMTIMRRELRWFAVAWAGISLLYILVAVVSAPFVRTSILGAWYADPYRIAALAPVVVIPLAALGVDTVVRLIARWARRTEPGAGGVSIGIAATTVLMLVLIIFRPVAMPAFLEGTFDRESRYLAADDAFLDPDERALLERLDDYVAPDERVIGNPSTGTGFGYFLSGRDVYPRTWSPPRTAQWDVLGESLRDAVAVPEVCDALAAYGSPEFVLDFGPGEQGPGRYEFQGMTGFEGQDGFVLIAEEGDASLWRITACDQ